MESVPDVSIMYLAEGNEAMVVRGIEKKEVTQRIKSF